MGITLFGPKKKVMNLIHEYKASGAVITSHSDGSTAGEKNTHNGTSVAPNTMKGDSQRYTALCTAQRKLIVEQRELNSRMQQALAAASNRFMANGEDKLDESVKQLVLTIDSLLAEAGRVDSRVEDLLLSNGTHL